MAPVWMNLARLAGVVSLAACFAEIMCYAEIYPPYSYIKIPCSTDIPP